MYLARVWCVACRNAVTSKEVKNRSDFSAHLAWAAAGLLTFLIILLVAQTALMFKVGHSEIDMGCSYYDSNRIIVNLSVECKFDVASKKLVL